MIKLRKNNDNYNEFAGDDKYYGGNGKLVVVVVVLP